MLESRPILKAVVGLLSIVVFVVCMGLVVHATDSWGPYPRWIEFLALSCVALIWMMAMRYLYCVNQWLPLAAAILLPFATSALMVLIESAEGRAGYFGSYSTSLLIGFTMLAASEKNALQPD